MNLKQEYRKKIQAAKKEIMGEFEHEVLQAVNNSPEVPYHQLAPRLGISVTELCRIVAGNGAARRRGQGSPSWRRRGIASKGKNPISNL